MMMLVDFFLLMMVMMVHFLNDFYDFDIGLLVLVMNSFPFDDCWCYRMCLRFCGRHNWLWCDNLFLNNSHHWNFISLHF